MEHILTQAEIDELLSAVEDGEIDARLKKRVRDKSSTVAGDENIYSIDLTRGQNYSKWRIANLDIVINSFARYYGISLSNSLQRSVSVSKEEIVSNNFEDFLVELKNFGVVGTFSLEPLKGKGLFVFDKALCFGLVEMLFGMAPECDFYILERDVTAIEANSIRCLMSEGCQVLNRAFSPLGPLDSKIIRVETNLKMVGVLPPDAEVIQIRFAIQVGDLQGDVLLIIPYFSLEPYKEKFREEGFQISESKKENKWSKALEREIMDMEISVSATWGDLYLTINEILGLEVGDIITMDYDKSSPIKIRAGKSSKFRAQPGLLNDRKAVRLVGAEPIGEKL